VRDMQVHVKVLGAMYIALAALGLLLALLVAIGLGGTVGLVGASGDPDAALAIPILGVVGTVLIAVMIVLCLPGLAAGVGLLYFKPWARVLGIVLAAISLVGFPWLTIVGGYGLWVLLSKDSEHLFDQPTRAITQAQ
jgi:hypothetical protein